MSFCIQNIILSIFLVSGYLAGGISGAYFSAGWAPVPSPDPLGIEKILSSLAATAVSKLSVVRRVHIPRSRAMRNDKGGSFLAGL